MAIEHHVLLLRLLNGIASYLIEVRACESKDIERVLSTFIRRRLYINPVGTILDNFSY